MNIDCVFFVALLYYKFGIDCCGIDKQSIDIARRFILSLNTNIDKKFLATTTEEYGYFEVLLILLWKRRKKPLKFQESEMLTGLKTTETYAELRESIKKYIEEKLAITFEENEYLRIKSMFGLQCIIPDGNYYIDFIDDKIQSSFGKVIEELLEKWRIENDIKYPFDKCYIYFLSICCLDIINRNVPPIQVVILSDAVIEVKIWKDFLDRFFPKHRIKISSVLLNTENKHTLLTLENCVVIVKRVFDSYLSTIKFKENVFIVSADLNITESEYDKISENIKECEKNIYEAWIEKMFLTK